MKHRAFAAKHFWPDTISYLHDATGSTGLIYEDDAHTIVDTYVCRAFGKVESHTGGDIENRRTYIGRYGYDAEEDPGPTRRSSAVFASPGIADSSRTVTAIGNHDGC